MEVLCRWPGNVTLGFTSEPESGSDKGLFVPAWGRRWPVGILNANWRNYIAQLWALETALEINRKYLDLATPAERAELGDLDADVPHFIDEWLSLTRRLARLPSLWCRWTSALWRGGECPATV